MCACGNVPDLNLPETGLAVLVKVDVDWEMCVDVAHLVLVALGDTDDHVVDDGADGAEGSDILARAVVELDVDLVLCWVGEGDRKVTEVLGELAYKTISLLFQFFFGEAPFSYPYLLGPQP